MADATNGKNKKNLDAFADDLDAMLNMGDSTSAQQVGEVDDDDAIDRLLMGDGFPQTEQVAEHAEFADIDALIADDLGVNRKIPSEFDEFDDLIDSMEIAPSPENEKVQIKFMRNK